MFTPFVRYRLPAFLYALALFWASSLSKIPLPKIGLQFQDKVTHFLAYAVFSYLIHRALVLPTAVVRRAHVWAVVLGTLYALSDEVHQFFVPGRTPELGDLIADFAGLLCVQVATWWYLRRQTG